MKNEFSRRKVDVWGGIECSLNRVDDQYMDQLSLSGHYQRKDDIELFASLGIKMMRYPVLWEKHCLQPNRRIDWTFTEERLNLLKEKNIEPIAGLVHHGSGPSYTNFYDGSFSSGLATYAKQVAEKFPWLEYYTPINEPLTTARFCGLYGHWYPHNKDEKQFLPILLEECKATVLAMQAIRTINPAAKLIQTEDLGKTHSTKKLRYQAEFENERRWLSLDLLCGLINESHPLWNYLLFTGISAEDLQFFLDNPCPPYIMGINHYVTSERYIDQRTNNYPQHTWGGNGRDVYADVEAVRVDTCRLTGPEKLLKEAWDRYNIPIAVTEVHLHCSREEQLRWFKYVWTAANNLKKQGVDIRAVTAWAMLGSFDWCSLLTKPCGIYEVGLFDIRANVPRPTVLTRMVNAFAHSNDFHHPVLEAEGWWNRPARIQYFLKRAAKAQPIVQPINTRPLLVIGKARTLGNAFSRICAGRSIHHLLYGKTELNICDPLQVENAIKELKPWGIINTAGFDNVDEAEKDPGECFLLNSDAPRFLAALCNKYGVKLVTFSSDLVFDGKKSNPYLESDHVSPLNVFGQSKAKAEKNVLAEDPNALVIRTSSFFGPWDQNNFVINTLRSLKDDQAFNVPHDVLISPTYLPDLVNNTLDLMLDDECGIWNITNKGEISWASLATEIANRGGFSSTGFRQVPVAQMGFTATRPTYSVLDTEKGFEMPTLDNALERFFREQELIRM
jgi:dTDP-4-dehydrorhamnose reductase